MEKIVGIVSDVFLTDNLMEIGFKIDINGEEIEVIEKQNEVNSKIYREDRVILNKISDFKYEIDSLIGE